MASVGKVWQELERQRAEKLALIEERGRYRDELNKLQFMLDYVQKQFRYEKEERKYLTQHAQSMSAEMNRLVQLKETTHDKHSTPQRDVHVGSDTIKHNSRSPSLGFTPLPPIRETHDFSLRNIHTKDAVMSNPVENMHSRATYIHGTGPRLSSFSQGQSPQSKPSNIHSGHREHVFSIPEIDLFNDSIRANRSKHSNSQRHEREVVDEKLLEIDRSFRSDTVGFLRLQLEKQREETDELRSKIDRLEDNKHNLLDEIKELDEKKSKVDHELTTLKSAMVRERQRYKRQEGSRESGSRERRLESGERDSVNQMRSDLETTRRELDNTKRELEDTRSRLSKVMGSKLTDNNPSITDLSDVNRPVKLAERYTELYDNQWTDAYDVINNGDERQTIAELKNILRGAMRVCQSEAEKQQQQIESATLLSEQPYVPDVVKHQIKELRKATAALSGKHLYERHGLTLGGATLQVPKYARECFHLCWLMTLQDPPVVLAPELTEGAAFDTDSYKAYTRGGGRVEFSVWPALHLHDGGPLLAKGIAQGCD